MFVLFRFVLGAALMSAGDEVLELELDGRLHVVCVTLPASLRGRLSGQ
jgi:hypothetical protein